MRVVKWKIKIEMNRKKEVVAKEWCRWLFMGSDAHSRKEKKNKKTNNEHITIDLINILLY